MRFRDRATGEIHAERVFGARALHRLYDTRLGRALTEHVLSRPAASGLYGLVQRSPWSRNRVEAFVRDLAIDANEAELPLGAYRSLDHFFTRRLREGARVIDPHEDHLVSPCDARVLAYREVPALLGIKGTGVSLEALVGDAAIARRFASGSALVCRLAPADYHRFHFPSDGEADAPHRVPGRLHSVHPIALRAGAPSFHNQRDVTVLETPRFGEILLVEIGALLVGTIVQSYARGPVLRGQEKGFFRFGGSTVALVTRPGRVVLDDDLVESTRAGIETLVRMGTRIGRAASETPS